MMGTLLTQKNLHETKDPGNIPEILYNTECALYEVIAAMPPYQEADDNTHEQFMQYLSIRLRKYSTYTTSWSDSIFTQFYEKMLTDNNVEAVTKEAKAFAFYFIFSYSVQLSPCFSYANEQNVPFTYQEIKYILDDIDNIEQSLEFILRLSRFNERSEADTTIYNSIFKIYETIWLSDFYQKLQKRLCHVEIERITQRYDRKRLPILSADDAALNQALQNFEKAYGSTLTDGLSILSSSIRNKVVPIVNELISYVQNGRTQDQAVILKVISAIDGTTQRINQIAKEKREQEDRLQLEVDLELLGQISHYL